MEQHGSLKDTDTNGKAEKAKEGGSVAHSERRPCSLQSWSEAIALRLGVELLLVEVAFVAHSFSLLRGKVSVAASSRLVDITW